MASEKLRVDIQALRGWAVALVLIYHAQILPWQTNGYLGVDIFFVVSGYLITGLIVREIDAGTFTLSSFFFRRARRLLPAAYVTFLLCAIASFYFQPGSEMQETLDQLIGALTFTANIVLWQQAGYFETSSELKPLLHIWSLSLEEQYYVAAPLLLMIIPGRARVKVIAGLAIASFALCIVMVDRAPSASFFLLPARAWEIGIGSLVAVMPASWAKAMGRPALAAVAIAVIFLLPLVPMQLVHPGFPTLFACLATGVLIARKRPVAAENAIIGLLARLGDISYSLYLVHWPLLAFAAGATVTALNGVDRFGLILAALVLAILMYRFIETPFRSVKPARARSGLAWSAAAGGTILVISLSALGVTGESKDLSALMIKNTGLDFSCDSGPKFVPTPQCQSGDNPKVMIWGDSNGMHLVDAFVSSSESTVIQATRAGCGPFLGLARYEQSGHNTEARAHGCLAFNQSVLSYLEGQSAIDTVILAGSFIQAESSAQVLLSAGGDPGSPDSMPNTRIGSIDLALARMKATVDSLRAIGKKVILVGPPALSDLDIGRCLELKAEGKMVIGGDRTNCEIDHAKYLNERAQIAGFMAAVSNYADVPVLDLAAHLCRAGTCQVSIAGVPLYLDYGHFTHVGSSALGKELGLGQSVRQSAR